MTALRLCCGLFANIRNRDAGGDLAPEKRVALLEYCGRRLIMTSGRCHGRHVVFKLAEG
jgi:hypothetical protein